MKLNKRITIRLTEQEVEELKKQAEETGLTLSDYIRAVLFGKEKRYRKPKKTLVECKELKNIAYELNKIGVNINQIARYVNSKKELDLSVLNHLVRIEQELFEIISAVRERNAFNQPANE